MTPEDCQYADSVILPFPEPRVSTIGILIIWNKDVLHILSFSCGESSITYTIQIVEDSCFWAFTSVYGLHFFGISRDELPVAKTGACRR